MPNNKKPIIGILPTYNLTNEENDPYKDIASFVSLYTDKIINSGGIPIGLLDKDFTMYTSLCDAYLWPGGNKLHPEFFHILVDALNHKKPVLGICLGAQGIATYLNIIEDQINDSNKTIKEVYLENKANNPYLILAKNPEFHNHYVTKDETSIKKSKHKIKIAKNSLLYDIYGTEELNVPSMHKMVIARISKDILVSARTIDGVIESVEYTKDGNNILGVQFHPEITEDQKIFDWLIKSCHKN